MKFCPYCGTEIPDNAATFCMECGKAVPEKSQQPASKKKKSFKRERKSKKEKISRKQQPSQNSNDQEIPVDDGYDGYYDDVLPEDSNTEIQTMDKQLLKKVIALGVGAVMIISACVAIMYMLG